MQVYNNNLLKNISLSIFLLVISLQSRAQESAYEAPKSYYEEGEKAYLIGDYEKALRQFNLCLSADAAYYDAYLARAAVKERLENLQGAIIDYTIYLEAFPEAAEALFSRGLARHKAKQFVLAINDFKTVLQRKGGETNTILYRQSPYGGGTNRIMTMQGSIDDQLYNYIGLALYELRDYATAKVYFDSALALRPGEADYFVHRGRAYEQLGNTDEALEDYNRALSLHPEHAIALHNIGIMQARAGHNDEAELRFTEAINHDPAVPYTYLERAYARLQSGNLSGALADYSSALEINQKDYETFVNRGLVKEKLGDLDGAFNDYTAAIGLRPDYEKAWSSRGNVLARQEKLKDAIDDYTLAIFYYPEYGQAYYNRAILKHRLGMTTACEDLLMAAKFDMTIPEKVRARICAQPSGH